MAGALIPLAIALGIVVVSGAPADRPQKSLPSNRKGAEAERPGTARSDGRSNRSPVPSDETPQDSAIEFHLEGVVLADGYPLPGVSVSACVGYVGNRIRIESRTDGDGRFDVILRRDLLEKMDMRSVTFEVDGFDVAPGPPLEVAADVADIIVNVRGATIAGRVLLRGAPIAGAFVRLGSYGRGRTTSSDAVGAYGFSGVAAGDTEIAATSKTPHASMRMDLKIARGGHHDVDLKLELGRSGSITGVVRDQRGEPVPGVTVRWDCGPCGAGAPADSAPDGTYRVDHLAGGGPYTASVLTSGGTFHAAAGRPFRTVVLADGATLVEGVDLAIDATVASIRGGVLDESGAPVYGEIVATDRVRTLTEADGSFELCCFPEGRYKVMVGERGERAAVADVPAGRDDLMFKLPDVATVHGTLEGFPSRVLLNIHVDRPESPLEGHGLEGAFTIENVPRGEHIVVAGWNPDLGFATFRVVAPAETRVVVKALPLAGVRATVDGLQPKRGTCFRECEIPGHGWWHQGAFDLRPESRYFFKAPIGLALRITCKGTANDGTILRGLTNLPPIGSEGTMAVVTLSPSTSATR